MLFDFWYFKWIFKKLLLVVAYVVHAKNTVTMIIIKKEYYIKYASPRDYN